MTGRGGFRADRLYLGWRHVLRHPDPGPPPRRPVPPAAEQLSQGWLAAQRREADRLGRPLWLAAGACLALLPVAFGLARAGLVSAPLTAAAMTCLAGLAAASGRGAWRGEQALRAAVSAEKQRVTAARAAQESRLFGWQEEHARRFRDWQQRGQAFASQPHWYPVWVPADIDRVDVAGGTLPGWSAMLTMIAAPRLAAGGEVTLLDLSESAAAADLLAAARVPGTEPLVWVLPDDLPRLDLGAGLPRQALADVLAVSAAAPAGPDAPPDPAAASAILDRLLGVLGDEASVAQVTAALRVLAEVGDPRADVSRGLLTAPQLAGIQTLYGRGAADRVVTERAWSLEARLRTLEPLGSALAPLPASPLRVLALDRKAGMAGTAVLGTYLTVALTHLLRQAPPGQPWRHTLCLAGAERLRGDVLDRLCDACEATRTGLVLAYRTLPRHVRERLGRGNTAVAFMRAGNAEDAKAASEQIGMEHRFVLAQLTETIGSSVTGTITDSYTSSVADSDSAGLTAGTSETTARSRGRGHGHTGFAPFAPRTRSGSRDVSRSAGTSDSESVTRGITASTSWGVSTSKAMGGSESLAASAQRSREFLVEPRELQQLPPTAAIVSYPRGGGPLLVMADVNPGILALPTATLDDLPAAGEPGTGRTGDGSAGDEAAGGEAAGDGAGRDRSAGDGAGRAAPPNLGPPPEPLDWRTRRG